MPLSRRSRHIIAWSFGISFCVITTIPFILSINHFDWGVSLLVLAPLLVWSLLRVIRALECWAQSGGNSTSVDPDFPDEVER